jgi:hypothetical protein
MDIPNVITVNNLNYKRIWENRNVNILFLSKPSTQYSHEMTGLNWEEANQEPKTD